MIRLPILLALAISLSSCSSIKTVLEAKPTQASGFLDSSHQLQEMDARSPFLRTWNGGTLKQRSLSAANTEIFIAPVETKQLRPIQKKMAARQHRRWNRERPVERIASEMQREFEDAFRKSRDPRYRLVSSPTANSMTLELALIELDPSSVSGNLVRKAASLQIGPLAAAGGLFTGGSIAIEGRLIDSTERWSIFEFADREKDKITFWTLRDFTSYGHSRVAIKEWARQFEETTRNPEWREMGDARIWTLRPW